MEKYLEEILKECGMDEKKLKDIKKISSLNENIDTKSKITRERNKDWKINISFKEKLNLEEFKKYLERNNITKYKFGSSMSGIEDYCIVLDSGFKVYFYNPYED